MRNSKPILFCTALAVFFLLGSCGSNPRTDDSNKTETEAVHKEHEQHDHDEMAHQDLENALQPDQVYDETWEGIHLILTYNAEENIFEGTVENVSGELKERVMIHINLSDGTELGPATMVELAHGEKRNVMLRSETTGFTSWSGHMENGIGDQGHQADSDHDHGHSHDGDHTHEH